jgi:hypothetical protein
MLKKKERLTASNYLVSSKGLESYISLYLPVGDSLMPTLSDPKTEINASSTSRQNLILFGIDPPYSSVRLLVPSLRN